MTKHLANQLLYRNSQKSNQINQSGIQKKTPPYNAGIEPVCIQKKNKCYQESNWCKIYPAPYNAGIEQVWYSEEKQMLTEIKLVQNTHWSF